MGPPLPVNLAEMKTSKLEYVALTQAYNKHLPVVHQASICLQAIMERPINEIEIPLKPAVPWKLPKPQQVLNEPVQIPHRTGLRNQTMGPPPNPHNKPRRINVYKDGVTEHNGRSREQLIPSRGHAQLPGGLRPVLLRPGSLLSTSVLQPKDINQSLNGRPDRRSSDLVSSLHLSKLAPSVTFRNEPEEPDSTPDFSVQFSTPVLYNELKRKMPSPYERSPDCKPVNKQQKVVIDLTSPELPARQAQPVVVDTHLPGTSFRKSSENAMDQDRFSYLLPGQSPVLNITSANSSSTGPIHPRMHSKSVPEIHVLLSTNPLAFRPAPTEVPLPEYIDLATHLAKDIQKHSYSSPNDLSSVPADMTHQNVVPITEWESPPRNPGYEYSRNINTDGLAHSSSLRPQNVTSTGSDCSDCTDDLVGCEEACQPDPFGSNGGALDGEEEDNDDDLFYMDAGGGTARYMTYHTNYAIHTSHGLRSNQPKYPTNVGYMDENDGGDIEIVSDSGDFDDEGDGNSQSNNTTDSGSSSEMYGDENQAESISRSRQQSQGRADQPGQQQSHHAEYYEPNFPMEELKPPHYCSHLSTSISAHLRNTNTLITSNAISSLRFYISIPPEDHLSEYGDGDDYDDNAEEEMVLSIHSPQVYRLRLLRFVLPSTESITWQGPGLLGQGGVTACTQGERDWLVFEVVDFLHKPGSTCGSGADDDDIHNDETKDKGRAFFHLAVPFHAVTSVIDGGASAGSAARADSSSGDHISAKDSYSTKIQTSGKSTTEPGPPTTHERRTRLVLAKKGKLPLVHARLHPPHTLQEWVEACGRGEASVEIVIASHERGVWE